MLNIIPPAQDISQETAARAFDRTSFDPEKRGESFVRAYIGYADKLALLVQQYAQDERQKAIAQQVYDDFRKALRMKALTALAAKSRCASSMIVGPANFPVRRAEKANEAEHKRTGELLHFVKNMEHYIEKRMGRVFSTQEKQEGEIETLRKRIAQAEAAQEFMKAANALVRKKNMEELKTLFLNRYGAGGGRVLEAFIVPKYGRVGYQTFELTNNLANIKRMKARLSELETKAKIAEDVGEKTEKRNGLEIVRNYTDDRLQLIFDGKPDEKTRAVLKSHGYKWSPRFGAWQRKLTQNALYSLKHHLLEHEALKQYA